MKPITDDVVHSLMQGIESREKSKRRSKRGARKSAKIIEFTRETLAKDDAVSLNAVRARKTISGVFCYVARLGNA